MPSELSGPLQVQLRQVLAVMRARFPRVRGLPEVAFTAHEDEPTAIRKLFGARYPQLMESMGSLRFPRGVRRVGGGPVAKLGTFSPVVKDTQDFLELEFRRKPVTNVWPEAFDQPNLEPKFAGIPRKPAIGAVTAHESGHAVGLKRFLRSPQGRSGKAFFFDSLGRVKQAEAGASSSMFNSYMMELLKSMGGEGEKELPMRLENALLEKYHQGGFGPSQKLSKSGKVFKAMIIEPLKKLGIKEFSPKMLRSPFAKVLLASLLLGGIGALAGREKNGGNRRISS